MHDFQRFSLKKKLFFAKKYSKGGFLKAPKKKWLEAPFQILKKLQKMGLSELLVGGIPMKNRGRFWEEFDFGALDFGIDKISFEKFSEKRGYRKSLNPPENHGAGAKERDQRENAGPRILRV